MLSSKVLSLSTFAYMAISTLAAPNLLPRTAAQYGDGPRDDYHCDGVAQQKKNLYAQQGTTLDYAIATLENFGGNCGSPNVLSNYPHGDNKDGPAMNCGPFKNNLASIQAHCGVAQGKSGAQVCDLLNTDNAAAVQCQADQIHALGQTGFFQQQRCGHLCTPTETGCGSDPTYTCAQGGQDYADAITHVQSVVVANPDNDITGGYQLHAI